MDLSIIIPVYNESENVKIIYDEILSALNGLPIQCEILFVNDGSVDTTLDELKKIRSSDPRVKILDLKRNFGQTPAIMAGFHRSVGDVIITVDGDLQNDPGDIPMLLSKINEGFDLVSGWRKDRKDGFLLRVIPSRIANWLISKTLGTKLHDYGCTLKAYRKDVVKDIRLYGEMHRFIPAIANWQGAKIAEVAVNHRPRKYGKTKYGINRTIKVLLDLMLMIFLSEYSTKPIRFFGGLGLISFLLGIITFVIAAYMKIFGNVDLTGNPLLIIFVLFVLVSIQLISFGLLGEISMRTYYESQNKKTYYINEIIG